MGRKLRSLIKATIPKRWRARFKGAAYSLYYFGFRFECPFCRGCFRRFLAAGEKHPVLKDKNVVGGGYRLNSRCPRCASEDRERLVYLYLANRTSVFDEHTKLLHVAPETNLEKRFREHQNIDYLTADLYSKAAMVKVDVSDIPYDSNSFDVIVCNHVLEHVPDDRKAMSELYRVLKPEGWAILQVPVSLSLNSTLEDATITTSEGREKVFGQADHVRLYARDYKDRLEQVGFFVEEFAWTTDNTCFGGPTNRYGLIEDEVVYRAFKPGLSQ